MIIKINPGVKVYTSESAVIKDVHLLSTDNIILIRKPDSGEINIYSRTSEEYNPNISTFSNLFTYMTYLTSDLLIENANSIETLDDWKFKKEAETDFIDVILPHTCNAIDGESSANMYKGKTEYRKVINVTTPTRCTYLQFSKVGQWCNVYVDDVLYFTSTCGYVPFVIDVSEVFRNIGEHTIKIIADNSPTSNIIPMSADFNFCNGIYEMAYLVHTDGVGFVISDSGTYEAERVHVQQVNVNKYCGHIDINTAILNNTDGTIHTKATLSITDADSNEVVNDELNLTVVKNSYEPILFKANVFEPHLWNGIKDPYLYTVELNLYTNDVLVDTISRKIGLRYYSMDPNDGFMLNGEQYPLRGVAIHQDFPGAGPAITSDNFNKSAALVTELGCNFLRLSHYPHSKMVFDRCDELGFITYTEIPWINHIGEHANLSYHNSIDYALRHMINNYYNHPSIIFWGLSNELNGSHWKNGADPQGRFSAQKAISWNNEFYDIAKELDPYRYVGFTSHDPTFNGSNPSKWKADYIASNQYKGWYGNESFEQFGVKMNQYRSEDRPFWGIGEYGCGMNPDTHSEDPLTTTDTGSGGARHDEEFGNLLHESYIKQIIERPWIVFSSVWVMFDFAVSGRSEGGTPNLNDKGLVTRDRVTKKDPFFLYKSLWSNENVCYITSRRFTDRGLSTSAQIKVYSNMDELTLYRDDVLVSKLSTATSIGVVYDFGPIAFSSETCTFKVVGTKGEVTVEDTVTWTGTPATDVVTSFTASDINMKLGDTRAIEVVYTPEGASLGKSINWVSNDTSIATVDILGNVTGVAVGNTTMKGILENGYEVTITVTVNPVEYLAYYDFATGDNVSKTVLDSKGTTKATLTNYTFNEDSGFVFAGLKSSKKSECVVIDDIDLSSCTNGCVFHLELVNIMSNIDRSRLMNLMSTDTNTLDIYINNSTTNNNLRFENDSIKIGILSDASANAQLNSATIEIRFSSLTEPDFIGKYITNNGIYNIDPSTLVMINTGAKYDCKANTNTNEINRVALVNRISDYSRALVCTIKKFYIEKL